MAIELVHPTFERMIRPTLKSQHIPYIQTLYLMLLLFSCSTNSSSNAIEKTNSDQQVQSEDGQQIGQYVVELFEDSHGVLWFGTMAHGVAKYDGDTLIYVTIDDGLAGNTVVSMAEDEKGNLWFGTHSGISKYDGETFTNFTSADGLCHDRISDILIDRFGSIWIGTWGGISIYNGVYFSPFEIPIPDVLLEPYQSTMDWVTQLMEDRHGNIWICRDGYGVCLYNGKSISHFTKSHGLSSNNVQAIEEDTSGNIWIGTRVTERDHPDPKQRDGSGGLCKLEGSEIIQFADLAGLHNKDIYTITEDFDKNIWIGTTSNGAYMFNGETFSNYQFQHASDALEIESSTRAIQGILQDRNGTFWFGCSGGLYQLKDDHLVNITQDGPWD